MRILLSAFILAAAGLAAQPAAADASAEARIAKEFSRLGMQDQRSACYGRVITSRLDAEKRAQAAQLMEAAKSGDDVRKSVNDVKGRIRGAFMLAKAKCG